ncbi:hypothetical protein D3C86_1689930 [compost metagenome]
MCTVQLNGIKTSSHGAPGTLDVLVDQSGNFMFFDCSRWGAEGAGDACRWREWRFVPFRIALGVLTAGMVQLHRNFRTFAVDRVDQITESTNEPVMVNAHRVAGRAPDFPIDRGVFGND